MTERSRRGRRPRCNRRARRSHPSALAAAATHLTGCGVERVLGVDVDVGPATPVQVDGVLVHGGSGPLRSWTRCASPRRCPGPSASRAPRRPAARQKVAERPQSHTDPLDRIAWSRVSSQSIEMRSPPSDVSPYGGRSREVSGCGERHVLVARVVQGDEIVGEGRCAHRHVSQCSAQANRSDAVVARFDVMGCLTDVHPGPARGSGPGRRRGSRRRRSGQPRWRSSASPGCGGGGRRAVPARGGAANGPTGQRHAPPTPPQRTGRRAAGRRPRTTHPTPSPVAVQGVGEPRHDGSLTTARRR